MHLMILKRFFAHNSEKAVHALQLRLDIAITAFFGAFIT
jgi:hypothetical protein